MLHEYGKPLRSLTQIKPTSHIGLKWRIGNKLKLSILGMCHSMQHFKRFFKFGFSNQELSQEFQLDNFGECLNRAKIAKIVRLENNNISTLNSILKGITSRLCKYGVLESRNPRTASLFYVGVPTRTEWCVDPCSKGEVRFIIDRLDTVYNHEISC